MSDQTRNLFPDPRPPIGPDDPHAALREAYATDRRDKVAAVRCKIKRELALANVDFDPEAPDAVLVQALLKLRGQLEPELERKESK